MEKKITMKRLNKTNTWELFNSWIFMDIMHFFNDVDGGGITDYDGQGQYIYADNNCNLYIGENDFIDFEELSQYDFFKLDEFVQKKSTKDYHLIGVFWYNK